MDVGKAPPGQQPSVGQYEAFQHFTMPGLMRVVQVRPNACMVATCTCYLQHFYAALLQRMQLETCLV